MLFNRVCRVLIGAPGQDGALYTGLRTTFHIKKTLTAEPNTCDITIYNLNNNSQKNIQKVEDICSLQVGYVDNNGPIEIFKGFITEVVHTKNPPDMVTQLSVDDGSKVTKTAKLSQSYAEGTGIKTIIRDVIRSFNIPQKLQNSLVDVVDKKFLNGFTAVGKSKDIMDSLAKIAGIEWSIQNNEIKVLKAGSADQTVAYIINNQTGLLRSPERINEASKNAYSTAVKATVQANQLDDRPGWKVISLLLPEIEPGNQVIIESNEISKGSKFKVIEVEHDGDTHGESWQTQLQVVDL